MMSGTVRTAAVGCSLIQLVTRGKELSFRTLILYFKTKNGEISHAVSNMSFAHILKQAIGVRKEDLMSDAKLKCYHPNAS
jgi:hypothetical protein